MSDLDLNKIKEQVGYNAPASDAQIRICNLKLQQSNLPKLPDEYIDLLKLCNGFSNEDAHIFGADIKNNNWYKDIAAFNIDYFHSNSANWLILGESDFFFFIYDSQQKKYYVVDRDTLDEEFSEISFIAPVSYMLRIE